MRLDAWKRTRGSPMPGTPFISPGGVLIQPESTTINYGGGFRASSSLDFYSTTKEREVTMPPPPRSSSALGPHFDVWGQAENGLWSVRERKRREKSGLGRIKKPPPTVSLVLKKQLFFKSEADVATWRDLDNCLFIRAFERTFGLVTCDAYTKVC
jgi:hypothetical protein